MIQCLNRDVRRSTRLLALIGVVTLVVGITLLLIGVHQLYTIDAPPPGASPDVGHINALAGVGVLTVLVGFVAIAAAEVARAVSNVVIEHASIDLEQRTSSPIQ